MKKNGFTLIEILAVIVIISILGMIMVPIVGTTISEAKNDVYENQISIIKDAASMWAMDNIDKIDKTNCDYYLIFYRYLIDGGYIEEELVNPKTDEKYKSAMKIMILNGNTDKKLEFKLEIEDDYGSYPNACV